MGGNYAQVLQLLDRTSTNVVVTYQLDSDGVISAFPYNYNGPQVSFHSPPIAANTWVWVAVAWQIQTGSNQPYGIRCLSMPLGGQLTTWGSADGLCALDTQFSSVNVGMLVGGTGPMLRIGCPSLYAMSSLQDVAYPSDITPPVEQSYSWYVNTTTGNDANDGLTPGHRVEDGGEGLHRIAGWRDARQQRGRPGQRRHADHRHQRRAAGPRQPGR
ncbi:MAG: hypothetical protein WDO13_19255 [Verrucomicrobiota bacterium]